MHDEQHVIKADDGHEIRVRSWRPEGPPGGVVQLLHGLGEHIDRYQRFAAACCDRGLAVVAHNRRGHGAHCDQYGYFAAKDGWRLVQTDALAVHKDLRERFEGLPVVLFGHSMGSFIAQAFVMNFTTSLAGLALSGSNWPSKLQLIPGKIVAYLEAWRLGRHQYSAILDKMGFGAFNRAFEPGRTGYEWLSRDEAEVDKYIADEFCGGPFTCGLWLDLLGGVGAVASEASLQRIASDLPVLILGGEDDPVGGDKGLGKLALHYAQTGHSRLTVKIYSGGRHEMLNETNRDEVTSNILDWISSHTLR